jgi:hypothetical protein
MSHMNSNIDSVASIPKLLCHLLSTWQGHVAQCTHPAWQYVGTDALGMSPDTYSTPSLLNRLHRQYSFINKWRHAQTLHMCSALPPRHAPSQAHTMVSTSIQPAACSTTPMPCIPNVQAASLGLCACIMCALADTATAVHNLA